MRFLVVLFAAGVAAAHIGSPDIFFEGNAGAYPVFVTIRPPVVIPGVAEIEIRAGAAEVRQVRITPTPLTGDGAKFAPTPDVARRSRHDPQFFTGSLWMMASGSWQVRVQVDGDRGSGQVSVPVPAVAQRTQGMDAAIGSLLFALMILLSAGLVSIAGAAARESQLEPGIEPDAAARGRARRVMAGTAAVVAAFLFLGNLWWKAEASAYDRYIYKPLEMTAALEEGSRLVLRLRDPGWLRPRKLDNFLPDHGHPMHMFVIRLPEMERVWHLHPVMRESGVFVHELPEMPAGRYRLFADVVHDNGFPETMLAEIDLPEVTGKPLEGDDSTGFGPPLSESDRNIAVAALEDGYRMIWERDPGGYQVRKAATFRFRVEDAEGNPAKDMELYMGMPGHAAFVRTDLSVFAHVHPSGSVPMASLALAEPHAGHQMMHDVLPPAVAFPYGLPQTGDYRIYVQVKRAGKVQTGVFDLRLP